LETTIAVPIIKENEAWGVAAIDISLKSFADYIAELKPFNQSVAYLLSDNGTIVGNTDYSLLGNNISEQFPQLKELSSLAGNGDIKTIKVNDEKTLISFSPIKIGQIEEPWYLYYNDSIVYNYPKNQLHP